MLLTESSVVQCREQGFNIKGQGRFSNLDFESDMSQGKHKSL
jgi:hypothetical protein